MHFTKKKIQGLLFFLLLVCSAFHVKAQQAYMRNYTVSDGLPSFEVHDVFQDSKGFIWFATDAGVSRFDGYSFHTFTSRDGLPDNTIFETYEDPRGRIWFRSFSGLLSYFDGKKIVQPPCNAVLRKILSEGFTRGIYVDEKDTLWLGFDGRTPLLKILPGFSTVIIPSLPDDKVATIREIAPGYFFADYPFFYEKQNGRFFSYHNKVPLVLPGPFASSPYCSCTKLSGGDLVMNMAVCSYIVRDRQVFPLKDSIVAIQYIPSSDNCYWACYVQKGAKLIRHTAGGECVLQSYLDGYTVSCCMEDREGGTWFTTIDKGVFYMPYPKIAELNLPLEKGEKITAFALSPLHEGIAGTSNGRIFKTTRLPVPTAVAPTDAPLYISCLFAYKHVFIAGGTGKSLEFSEDLKSYSTLHLENGKNLPLGSMTAYKEQELYAIATRAALFVNVKNHIVRKVATPLPDRMRCACKGNGDTLWMGGLKGLWLMTDERHPVCMAEKYPQLGERIEFLYFDSLRNRLWIASRGKGLLLKEGNKVIDFAGSKPAIAVTCSNITQDAAGDIWVAGNAGAFCVHEVAKDQFTVKEFSMHNGLSSNDIISICCYADTVWMATSDKIIRFRSGDYPHTKKAAPVYLDAIKINGRNIDSTQELPEPVFDHSENTFSFSFVGLSYRDLGKVMYRFRLIGADSGWTETHATEASYYKLPPGNYTFCVYAMGNENLPELKPAKFSFVILVPFWKSWWFITAVILIVLAAPGLFLRYQIRRVRRKEIFNRRLIEMEMTALRAQMNPHFIFNSLNSIQNFVMKGNNNASATYFSKFSRLIRRVLENSSQRQILLSKELEVLHLYLEIEQMRFSGKFSFTIETDPELDLHSLMIVPMLLQPYVENAIWHGLLQKKGGGELKISLEDTGQMLRCTIDDNGIGREKAREYRQHKKTGNTSMGGELSLRRLNLLNSLYGTKFSLQYTDKYKPDGSSDGTRVELLIPKMFKSTET